MRSLSKDGYVVEILFVFAEEATMRDRAGRREKKTGRRVTDQQVRRKILFFRFFRDEGRAQTKKGTGTRRPRAHLPLRSSFPSLRSTLPAFPRPAPSAPSPPPKTFIVSAWSTTLPIHCRRRSCTTRWTIPNGERTERRLMLRRMLLLLSEERSCLRRERGINFRGWWW